MDSKEKVRANFTVKPFRNMAENVFWIIDPDGNKRIVPDETPYHLSMVGTIEDVNQLLQNRMYTLKEIFEHERLL